MPKATHVVTVRPTGKQTITEHIVGGPAYVYGQADLRRRLADARKTGITLIVRKIQDGEE